MITPLLKELMRELAEDPKVLQQLITGLQLIHKESKNTPALQKVLSTLLLICVEARENYL